MFLQYASMSERLLEAEQENKSSEAWCIHTSSKENERTTVETTKQRRALNLLPASISLCNGGELRSSD
jgi:hypothetical protein